MQVGSDEMADARTPLSKAMVKIGLQISANLENVTNLIPEDLGKFRWHLKIKCSKCGEINPKWQNMALNEEYPKIGAKSQTPPRGFVNYLSKCKLCLHHNSLEIDEESIRSYSIKGEP